MDLEEAYDKIYRYAYFKLNNQSAAEDVTQETFLRWISQKGNVREYEIKYLYTIARNLCIDEYRRVKPDPIPEDYDAPAPYDDRQEERMMVREALEKLPPEDQEILLLRHVNGEAVGTICKALGISRFAAYRRLKSAEDKLRVSLEVNEG